MAISFQIEPSSGVPIYKQIIEQVTRLVASGALAPGDELPSVRTIARHYEVNAMTISKAYGILEATGVLERLRGKGMIIARNHDGAQNKQERLNQLQPILYEAAKQTKQLAISSKDAMALFKKILESKNE